MPEDESSSNSALTRMRGLIAGFLISRSIATVAELGIADRLANGSRTAAELANECGVQERSLFRVLRALSGEGIFTEGEDGQFGLTPMADLLRSDHPRSLRDWAIYVTDLTFRASVEMPHTVRTGELAFPQVFGVGLFEYFAQHPADSEKLLRAMSSINAARTAGLLEAYDFGQANWLVDVGGAHGTMVAAIAEQYPQLRCTTFDRPGAELGARKTFADRTVADRCAFVGGDFFTDVPAGADVYLLSAILHDWDDQRCRQILGNCRKAISETGRLLVVDIVLSDEKNVPDTYRNCLDLAVMLQLGGMERTESEFRNLLTSAGFTLRQVLSMNAPQSVLVAIPD